MVRSASTEMYEGQSEEDIILKVGKARVGMTRKVKIVKIVIKHSIFRMPFTCIIFVNLHLLLHL